MGGGGMVGWGAAGPVRLVIGQAAVARLAYAATVRGLRREENT